MNYLNEWSPFAAQWCRNLAQAGVFNAAGFGLELRKVANLKSDTVDGRIVKVILCGRPDVSVLSGGSHFRLLREGVRK